MDQHFMLLRNWFVGYSAASCGLFVGYPFDTLKLRYQCLKSPLGYSLVGGRYSKKPVHITSFLSYYKGVSSPIIVQLPKRATQFLIYDYFCEKDKRQGKKTPSTMIGAVCGIIYLPINIPMHVWKVRKQLNLPFEFKKIYSGWKRQLFRDPLFGAVFFGTMDWAKKQGYSGWKSGSIAGVCTWLICSPIDAWTSSAQANLKVVRWYGGLHFMLVRTIFVSGTTVGMYEYLKALFPV